MEKITLSLTLIVRNEEKHMERVLEHAHLFADEIVIVDTGSVDRTKELAAKFTDKIFDFEWVHDFAKARNHGVERCTGDFIMWLDADDVLTEEGARGIREAVDKAGTTDVFYVPYLWAQDHTGRTKRQFKRERIFRNGKRIGFKYPIHEVLDLPAGVRAASLDEIIIVHKNVHRWEPRGPRNLEILRRCVRTEEYRDDPRIWWYLGREEDAEVGICVFQRLLSDFSEGTSRGMLARYWYGLAEKCFQAERYEKALEACGQSMVVYPRWREPFFLAGRVHWRCERYEEALRLFEAAGQIPLDDGLVLEMLIYDGYVYYDHLSLTYARLGRFAEAVEAVDKALERLPGDRRFLDHRASWESKRQPKAVVDAVAD